MLSSVNQGISLKLSLPHEQENVSHINFFNGRCAFRFDNCSNPNDKTASDIREEQFNHWLKML